MNPPGSPIKGSRLSNCIGNIESKNTELQEMLKTARKELEDSKAAFQRLYDEHNEAERVMAQQERSMEFFQMEHQHIHRQLSNKAKQENTTTKKDNTRKQADMKSIISKLVFPKYKFLHNMYLYDLGPNSLAYQIMSKLGLDPETEMPKFWSDNLPVVEKCFQDYRTGSQQQMKKYYFEGSFIDLRFSRFHFSNMTLQTITYFF